MVGKFGCSRMENARKGLDEKDERITKWQQANPAKENQKNMTDEAG